MNEPVKDRQLRRWSSLGARATIAVMEKVVMVTGAADTLLANPFGAIENPNFNWHDVLLTPNDR